MATAIFFITILFWLTSPALANDAAMAGIGGRPRLMEKDHPAIRMVREWVRMDVYPDHYSVKATFVFHNRGDATSVRMGFPETSDNVGSNESTFDWFKTWVNGKRTYAKRINNEKAKWDEPNAYWIKTVRFEREQTLSVRVEYQGGGGRSVEGDHWASYQFTGGNWYGDVEETALLIVLHLPGANLVFYDPQLRRKGNRISGRWQGWNAQGEVNIRHVPTIHGALLLEEPLQKEFSRLLEYYCTERPFNEKDIPSLIVSEQPGRNPNTWCACGPALLRRKEGIFVRYNILAKFHGVKELVVNNIRGEDSGDPREVTIVGHDADKKLTFRVGSPEATLADGRALRLRKAPFIKQVHSNSVMYVPFEPVSEVFGGVKLTINNAARRANIEFERQ